MKKIAVFTMIALALATSFTACKDADEEDNHLETCAEPTAVNSDSDFLPLVISIRVLSPEGYSILNAVNSQFIKATFRGLTFECDMYLRGYNAQPFGLKRHNDILLFGELNGAQTYENEQIILSWGDSIKSDTITFTHIPINYHTVIEHFYVNGVEQWSSSTWPNDNSSKSNCLTIYKELPTYEVYVGEFDSVLDSTGTSYAIKNMPLTMDEKDCIYANSLIAMQLLNNLSIQGEYTSVFSPLALFNACGILANGLSEDSKEVREALAMAMGNKNWGNSLSKLNHVYKTVNEYLPLVDPYVQASAPTGLFMHNGFTLYKGFVDLIAENYQSDYALFDFNDGYTTLMGMKNWQSQKTQGCCTDPSFNESYDPMAIILTVSKFKAYWTQGYFNPEETQKATWVNMSSGAGRFQNYQSTVDMMHGQFHTRHWVNNYFEYLELPLANQAWEMTVLLPKERGDLQFLFNNMSAILGSENQAETKDVEVYLPRFQWGETRHNLIGDLQTVLNSQGYSFNPLTAHYGEISPDKGFHPTRISQETKFMINETGCTTFVPHNETRSAITKQHSPAKHTNPSPSDVVTFRADSPFVFFIRERSSGVILIAGLFDGMIPLSI